MTTRKPPTPDFDLPTWLRNLPKVELHLHLEGTIEPRKPWSRSPAATTPPPSPLTTPAASIPTPTSSASSPSFKSVTTPPAHPRRLRAHRLQHGPAPSPPRASSTPRSTSPSASSTTGSTLKSNPLSPAIERGRLRGEREFGTTLYWLIDAVRNFGPEEAARVFRKAAELRQQYPSIVGIGIGGDESRGPASLFKDLYAEAREAGRSPHRPRRRDWRHHRRPRQHLVRHQHRRRAHRPRPRRPPRPRTHAGPRHPASSPSKSASPPTSAPAAAPRSTTTPCAPYFDTRPHGHPNSDDPPMFATHPPRRVRPRPLPLRLLPSQLRELAANSVEASFLPPARKLALLSRIERYR